MPATTPQCELSFFNAPPPSQLYTLSLHDALPISSSRAASATAPWSTSTRRPHRRSRCRFWTPSTTTTAPRTPTCTAACTRSEEHTSELQSHVNLVCRLLLEKKKNTVLHHSVHHPH